MVTTDAERRYIAVGGPKSGEVITVPEDYSMTYLVLAHQHEDGAAFSQETYGFHRLACFGRLVTVLMHRPLFQAPAQHQNATLARALLGHPDMLEVWEASPEVPRPW